MLSIGSAGDCDIVVTGETVAARHAEIEGIRGNRLIVRDCASPAGLFVERNGRWQRAAVIHLGPQDRIRFGSEELTWSELTGATARLGLPARDSDLALGEGLDSLAGSKREVLQRPWRNPQTGKLEERPDESLDEPPGKL